MAWMAYTFHFQPSEINEMTLEEFEFWTKGLDFIGSKIKV